MALEARCGNEGPDDATLPRSILCPRATWACNWQSVLITLATDSLCEFGADLVEMFLYKCCFDPGPNGFHVAEFSDSSLHMYMCMYVHMY